MGTHKIKRFIADTWKDYELIDSGEGGKLEKFGGLVLDRPEASAVWDRGQTLKNGIKLMLVLNQLARLQVIGSSTGRLQIAGF